MGAGVARLAGATLVGAALLGAGCAAAPAETEAAATTAPAATGSTAATTSTTAAPTTTAYVPPPLPEPSPALGGTADDRVFVLGDSVVLGAGPSVTDALAGRAVVVDAAESRLIDQGLVVLRTRKAEATEEAAAAHETAVALATLAGAEPPPEPEPLTYRDVLGPVVVVSLCTNYSAGNGFGTYVDRYMEELSSVDRVVWVTCGEWSPGQVEANAAVREAAGRHERLVVADWAPYGAYAPYTYDDGIHLNGEGRPVMGDLVARAVGPLAAG